MLVHKPLEFPCTFIKITDKMETIRSEARLSIRSTSRPAKREKVMALAAAENPHLSRLAGCLLKTNVSVGQDLKTQLVNIQREHRRLMYNHELARQSFLSKSWTLNHQPVIVLERPTAVCVETRFNKPDQAKPRPDLVPDSRHKFKRTLHVPACPRTPLVPTTIDLFVRVRKKKLNLWEEGSGETKEFSLTNAKSKREFDLTELKAAYGIPTGEASKTNQTKSVYGNLLTPFTAYHENKNVFSVSSSSFSWSLASEDMLNKLNLRPHTSFRRLASVAKQVSRTNYRSVRSAPAKAGGKGSASRPKIKLL